MDASAESGTDAAAECPKKPVPEHSPQSVDDLKAQMQALAGDLSHSDDAEHLLAAALLGGFAVPGAPLELLDKASRIVPSNALVAWHRLKICRELAGATCDLEEIETIAVEVDSDNGAVWMQVAMLRFGEDRHNAAADAVRRAIVAPRFDNYFIDNAGVIERALTVLGGRSYAERVFMGIGVAAASMVSYQKITTQCAALAGDGGVWLELCDRLGARMTADGNTLIDQAIGTSLRKIAAQQSGDEAWIEAATANEVSFRDNYQRLLATIGAHHILENDEVVLRQYIENFSTYGELEAQTRLKEEAQRLREDPDYDQCNFVSAWTSQ